jgi:hypothetical protein
MLTVCLVLTACKQVDDLGSGLHRAQMVAADLEDMVGLRPSTEAIWENGEFAEFVVEFSQATPGFKAEQIEKKAGSAVVNHFGASPQKLTIRFVDSGDG